MSITIEIFDIICYNIYNKINMGGVKNENYFERY